MISEESKVDWGIKGWLVRLQAHFCLYPNVSCTSLAIIDHIYKATLKFLCSIWHLVPLIVIFVVFLFILFILLLRLSRYLIENRAFNQYIGKSLDNNSLPPLQFLLLVFLFFFCLGTLLDYFNEVYPPHIVEPLASLIRWLSLGYVNNHLGCWQHCLWLSLFWVSLSL